MLGVILISGVIGTLPVSAVLEIQWDGVVTYNTDFCCGPL